MSTFEDAVARLTRRAVAESLDEIERELDDRYGVELMTDPTPPPMSAETISEAGEAITDIASAIEAAARIADSHHGGLLIAAAIRRQLTARVAVAPEATPIDLNMALDHAEFDLEQHCNDGWNGNIPWDARETLRNVDSVFKRLRTDLGAADYKRPDVGRPLDPALAADPAVEGTGLNVRDIALAAIKRARRAGESQEMLARWIDEDVTAALARSVGPDLREALERIAQWCDAYPIEMFPEPDLDAVNDLLAKNDMRGQIDRMHASWARHITSGIRDIARSALGEAR